MEGAMAHTATVAAKGQVVVGISPAESLRGDQNTSLLQLVVVTQLSVLAPAGLVLALLAVLAAVSGIIFHLVDVIEATSVSLIKFFSHSGCRYDIIVAEVVNVAVLGA